MNAQAFDRGEVSSKMDTIALRSLDEKE